MWDGNWILHKCKEGYPEEYEPVWILLERVNKRGMKEVLAFTQNVPSKIPSLLSRCSFCMLALNCCAIIAVISFSTPRLSIPLICMGTMKFSFL